MIEEAKGLWIGFLTAEAEKQTYPPTSKLSSTKIGKPTTGWVWPIYVLLESSLSAVFFLKLHQNKKLIVWMSAACDLKYCYSIWIDTSSIWITHKKCWANQWTFPCCNLLTIRRLPHLPIVINREKITRMYEKEIPSNSVNQIWKLTFKSEVLRLRSCHSELPQRCWAVINIHRSWFWILSDQLLFVCAVSTMWRISGNQLWWIDHFAMSNGFSIGCRTLKPKSP